MKNKVILVSKIAFWVIFFYYTGLFQEVGSMFSSDTKRPSFEEERRATALANTYLAKERARVEQQIANGVIYSAKEYFVMLDEITRIEDSTGVSFGMMLYDKETLWKYFTDNVQSGAVSSEDIEQAREQYLKHSPIKKDQQDPYFWNHVGNWWKSLYINMLPFVVLLFFVWIYEGKEKKVLSLKSPLCFIFLVFVHPIYITLLVRRWWGEQGRAFRAESEIRRRKKNVFESLSTQERHLVTVFAKTAMSFNELKGRAHAFGHRKHHLFIALVALVCCSISKRILARHESNDLSIAVVSVQDFNSNTTVSVDIDVGKSESHFVLYADFAQCVLHVPLTLLIKRIKRQLSFLLLRGYKQVPEPVPLGR